MPFSSMKFRYPFRKYQNTILENIITNDANNRHHLVAPPGAGKTILGLELVRRFGNPAVVFAPTSTIQLQWAEKVSLFTVDQAEARALTSLNPKALAPINIFTYQLISAASHSKKYIEEIALTRWKEDLLEDGIVSSPEEAAARIETIQQNNPLFYRSEISRRYKRIKRQLLHDDDIDIGEFLHPNACALIENLVSYGVRTVVLDECHHLLDYWAIVLRYLIRKIDSPRVIGLTATLPSLDGDDEFENYDSLLGEVDFEVPTPAVVKEGNLAPYRDFVFLVKPSKREVEYLKNIQAEFAYALDSIVQADDFKEWLFEAMLSPKDKAGEPIPWGDFWNKNPLFAIAGYRFLYHQGKVVDPSIPVPFEAQEKMELDDWITLLENYALNKLVLSPDKEDHKRFQKLRKTLLPYGLSLTERGIRQSRSVGDLVLTFSESKDFATAHILEKEFDYMQDRLRAIVVTDFEKMNSGVNKKASDVLAKDAGSAQRLFKNIARHPIGKQIKPILVTGRTIMVAKRYGEPMCELFNTYLRENDVDAICELHATKDSDIFKVTGEGKSWKSSTYVRMITSLFEKGVTKCLVGTRGIFGEGWDSLSLNTLIDLTSVTTSTSVQQLRGRSIRNDPLWAHKVAHNWDVVAVSGHFERGYIDFSRFLRRHSQYWGIVTYPGKPGEATFKTPRLHGKIVKGSMHVSPELTWAMVRSEKLLDRLALNRHNRMMIREAKDREKTYLLWDIGGDYQNFTYKTSQLETKDLKIHTVFTIQNTLKAMIRAFRETLIGSFVIMFYRVFIGGLPHNLFWLVLMVGFAFLLTFAINARNAYKLAKKFLVEQPHDAILKDVAIALLSTLRDTGLVSRNLPNEYIRVMETQGEGYQVFIDYASPEDVNTFVKAYQDIFSPLINQRYIILRTDDRLPSIGLRPFWFILRAWFRDVAGYESAYYPVPKILGSRKKRAERFAYYWEKYVGGGQLIYTRSQEGRYALLTARAQRRPKVKNIAFEFWR